MVNAPLMDESFLPYAMIEPLLTPGMTGQELAAQLTAWLHLPDEGYMFMLADPDRTKPLAERLRGGLRVMKSPGYTHFSLNAESVR